MDFPLVRVKRWGKSLPGCVVICNAVHLMGCKVMYTDVCRVARPLSGGRLLKLIGDNKRR